MIFDRIDNYKLYAQPGSIIYQALKMILELKNLPDGGIKNPLPDGAYYIVQNNVSRYEKDACLETHKKFIDIQYLISGEEYMRVAPLPRLTDTVSEEPERDLYFHSIPADAQTINMYSGYFCIFFPEDAHAPLLAKKNDHVKKILVKIPVENIGGL